MIEEGKVGDVSGGNDASRSTDISTSENIMAPLDLNNSRRGRSVHRSTGERNFEKFGNQTSIGASNSLATSNQTLLITTSSVSGGGGGGSGANVNFVSGPGGIITGATVGKSRTYRDV